MESILISLSTPWASRQKSRFCDCITPQMTCLSSTLLMWMQRDFIKYDLGPALAASLPDLILMMHDDQRTKIVDWSQVVLSDEEAAKVYRHNSYRVLTHLRTSL
jgi:hypothetical protein